MATSSTSFVLDQVRTKRDLLDACAVRALAYGHHVPGLGTTLNRPDALDGAPGTVILLCRDKRTGAAIATARLQHSGYGPLQIERSVDLPANMRQGDRVEITRLAANGGADRAAKLMLMKASYLYCLATQANWIVIGARSEALIRGYRRLGFDDLLPSGQTVPLAHAGHLPHRLLAFDVPTAETRWRAARHPLLAFMVDTAHVDLLGFGVDTPAQALSAAA